MALAAETSTSPPTRVLNADVTRALAIWMVVFLHVAAAIATRFGNSPRDSWWVANIVDSLCRPCVPLFILLSGRFLLDPARPEPTGVFFRKRALKVLLPFVVWGFIYGVWGAFLKGDPLDLGVIVRSLINGTAYWHLWYLYALIGIYLATPILRIYARGASRRDLAYFVALWAAVVGLIPVLERGLDDDVGIRFVVTTGLIGYFVAGYLLRDVRLPRERLWIPAVIYLAGSAVIIVGSYLLSLGENNKLDQFLMQNSSLTVIATSLSGYVFLNSLPLDNFLAAHPRLKSGILSFSAMSMGIYLIHVIVLESLNYRHVVPRLSTTWPMALGLILAFSLFGLAVSYGAVFVLRKIPLIRALVP